MIKKQSITAILLLLLSCINKDPAVNHLNGKSDWTQDSTTHFRLKAQPGVRSEKKLKAIGKKMEVIQQELLTMLNETEEQTLVVYFLKDRNTLASYTGFPANGYTDTGNGIIYFVDQEPFHLALRHETMHALSWRFWGTPGSYWLSEGLAVYASGNCGSYSLHVLAHALNKKGKIQSIKTLTENFDLKALEPSLQAASLVKFIYETYGSLVLKHFWQNGVGSPSDSIGISVKELERAWKEHIDLEQFDINVNWNKIKVHGCE